MLSQIESLFRAYLGGISAEEKESVYAEMLRGSSPSNDFFTMLIIAAVIASVGLLTNSPAAIIGAMLVSPLLIPAIGLSLGAVKGDIGLFRRAVEAEAKGAALVLGLVVVLTLLVPGAGVTAEILARTRPTPLDLLVALASGAAGAYALSKKSIGATLPGVAIAVAILPPLCVAGIGFALRRPDVALGGALMFLANMVAINFAASAVFWLLGFSPGWQQAAQEDVRQKLKTSALLLLVILLPLAWIMWESVSTADARNTVEEVLGAQLDGIVGARLVEFSLERSGAAVSVFATVDSPKKITQEKAEEMKVALEKKLRLPVDLSLNVNYVELVQAARS